MEVPESIDVIMNVTSPIVLWNIIVSVVVASWCGQEFTVMVVLLVRVNGALNAQIYQDEILQHHVVPLINVTGGIFQHVYPRPHTARICRDFLQQNKVHVSPWPARWSDEFLIAQQEMLLAS